MDKKRDQWSSNLGFILAAAGSAVGLGNIWKFPYKVGNGGGAAFVLVYILVILILGITVMLAELTVGRHTQKNAVGAFRQLDKRFTFVGGLGIVTGFVVLSYYSVVGGWVMKYMFSYLTGANFWVDGKMDTARYFANFTAGYEPIIWHILFMAAAVVIVIRGVSGGIEKANKIMMPGLLILLVLVAVRSVTLPGAAEGVKFFLLPDFSKLNAQVIVSAMGQATFSLSIGMGVMSTYGSYLSKNENLAKNAVLIAGIDTVIALLSGFAILPAVFAAGLSPTEGSGLAFITFTAVFDKIPFGGVFGFVFFLLLFFSALTSAISILEGTTAYVVEELHIKRKTAVVTLGSIMAALGVFASLSNGAMHIKMPWWGPNGFSWVPLMDGLGFLTDELLMPVGAFLFCIFVGWVWGAKRASAEIKQGGKFRFAYEKIWTVCVKFVAPAAILLVLLSSFGVIRF